MLARTLLPAGLALLVACAADYEADPVAVAPGPLPDGGAAEEDGGPSEDATAPPRDSGLDASDATVDGALRDGGTCPSDPSARPNDGLVEVPYVAGCPAGMIRAGAVCIDRYEAFVVLVDGAGRTIATTSPYYPPPSGAAIAARSAPGAVPQGYISGAEALRACQGAGKRLCTSAEWLRACQGASGRTYPYGNTRQPGVCNDSYAGHPAATCFGTTDPSIYSRLGDPGINQQANTVDRTGANPGCRSEDGAYDLMGNLHEWVLDGPPPPAVSAVDFRGGFYADTKINGEGCLYRTSAHNFSHWDYSTGFRCCADPQ